MPFRTFSFPIDGLGGCVIQAPKRSFQSCRASRARHGLLRVTLQNMTSVRQITARIFEEERQREAARQAAIDAALAKPPLPYVTKENWDQWHRHGWIVCPAKRHRFCLWYRRQVQAPGRDWACRRRLTAPTQGPASLRRLDPDGRSLSGSGSSLANPGATASTAGSQPAPGPPRARRGSQRRSAGGGLSGEFASGPELIEAPA